MDTESISSSDAVATTRIEALVAWLNANGYPEVEAEDISLTIVSRDYYFYTADFIGADFYVLLDHEASEMAEEQIEQSLWAFNTNFLYPFMPPGMNEKAIKAIQELYEDGNESLKLLIQGGQRDKFALFEKFCDEAVAADGRGHFLSSYDGEEAEWGDYYIYRIN